MKKTGKMMYDGKMECKCCGRIWMPQLESNGKVPYGGWQCPYGCRLD